MPRSELLRNIALRVSWILLPLAVGVFAVGLTLTLLGSGRFPIYALSFASVFVGAWIWYAGYVLGHRRRFYFASTFLFLTAALLFFMKAGVIALPHRAVWPFLMLFVGIAFLVAGHARLDKFHPAYFIPAVAFSGLGFFFLLFTTDIIPFSLGSVVLWWSPVIFLPAILSFSIWLYRRNKAPAP